MKRRIIILGIALSLSGSTFSVRAHGGCYGFWPFWPFALGAGLAIASVASAQNHSSPTYVYTPAEYSYPYSSPPPQNPTINPLTQTPAPSGPAVQPEPNPLSSWVPSSPGAGHWVPDPTPYTYSQAPQPKSTPAIMAEPRTEVITLTHSAGNVPVYTISR